MKRLFISQSFPDSFASTGLLLARLLTGTAMMLHGLPKIQNPMAWGDKMGIPPVFQLLAAVAEFGGGIAWILGLLVPLASLGVFATMAVAKFTAHANDPLVAPPGGKGWESAGLYAALAVLYFCVGPGKFSVDYYLAQALNKQKSSDVA